jgi:hypothetical protein
MGQPPRSARRVSPFTTTERSGHGDYPRRRSPYASRSINYELNYKYPEPARRMHVDSWKNSDEL